MSTTPSSRPRLDDALLSEFDTSGQSAASFARSRGMPPWRIYNALNRRNGKTRRRAPSADLALLPVRVVPEARVSRPSTSLTLELSGGQRLSIGADFDPLLLRRVVEALAPC
jgi:hypothetical protein